MARFITIASGKEGAGKTSLSVNLGLEFSRMGHRTCLFDANPGPANINILLGLFPSATLKDVILEGRPIREIMIRFSDRFHILPGSPGIEEMTHLSENQTQQIIRSFLELNPYDIFLFDTSTGITKEVVSFCMASPEVLVLITPDPESLTDSYALIKVLIKNGYKHKIKIVINRSKSLSQARLVFGELKSAVEKHLHTTLFFLGFIIDDKMVPLAIEQQKPLLTSYPKSIAGKCILKIAQRLEIDSEDPLIKTDPNRFWEQCMTFFKSSLPFTANKMTEIKPKPPKITIEEALPRWMEKLNDTIATVAEELKGVRHAIENMVSIQGVPDEKDGKEKIPESISLDFEAFAKNRESKRKDN